MKWEHIDVININPNFKWWKSHLSAPVPFLLNDKTIRVLFGAFDENNVSRIGFVDIDIDTFKQINYSHLPLLDIGEDGTFDENGVHPMGIVYNDCKLLLYYTGYQLGKKVPYFMFAGLAISDDGGNTFSRYQRYPVLDRSEEGLCTRGGPTGFKEDNTFKLWYAAGSTWELVGGKPRPTYNIYFQESKDGINFINNGYNCINYNPKTEHGLGRPQVIKAGKYYIMFHTIRTIDMKYSIGFATSKDGKNWKRRDNELGLTHGKSGWNSEMIYFPYFIKIKDDYFLFYNGNGFGKTGIGIEKLIDWEFDINL